MEPGMEIVTQDLRAEIAQVISDCGKVGTMVIDTPQTAQTASNMINALASTQKKIKAMFKMPKEKAYAEHKAITEAEKKTLAPLADAEKTLRDRLTEYATEQERKRRQAEEETRRQAQAESKRLIEQAQQAQAEGKLDIAQDLFDEADAIDMVTDTLTVAQTANPDGITFVKDYVIDFIDYEKLPTTINGMPIVKLDTATVIKLIKASNGKIKIPGISYTEIQKPRRSK